jgi:hypothetical protein
LSLWTANPLVRLNFKQKKKQYANDIIQNCSAGKLERRVAGIASMNVYAGMSIRLERK